jgi:hypothetical protein
VKAAVGCLAALCNALIGLTLMRLVHTIGGDARVGEKAVGTFQLRIVSDALGQPRPRRKRQPRADRHQAGAQARIAKLSANQFPLDAWDCDTLPGLLRAFAHASAMARSLGRRHAGTTAEPPIILVLQIDRETGTVGS